MNSDPLLLLAGPLTVSLAPRLAASGYATLDWLSAGPSAHTPEPGESPVAAVLGAGQAVLIRDLRNRFGIMPIVLDLERDSVEARAACTARFNSVWVIVRRCFSSMISVLTPPPERCVGGKCSGSNGPGFDASGGAVAASGPGVEPRLVAPVSLARRAVQQQCCRGVCALSAPKAGGRRRAPSVAHRARPGLLPRPRVAGGLSGHGRTAS